jgi:hypothetical protein
VVWGSSTRQLFFFEASAYFESLWRVTRSAGGRGTAAWRDPSCRDRKQQQQQQQE